MNDTLLKDIEVTFGIEALIAWDRDGMAIPGEHIPSLYRWNGTKAWKDGETWRYDGLGCVTILSTHADTVWESSRFAVLVTDPNVDLGVRWEYAPPRADS